MKLRRTTMHASTLQSKDQKTQKWIPPAEGSFKLNVDVSIRTGADEFSTSILIRDHEGTYIVGCVSCTSGPGSVLEAETSALYESLSWLQSLPFRKVLIESDSLLIVQAIRRIYANRKLVICLIIAKTFSDLD